MNIDEWRHRIIFHFPPTLNVFLCISLRVSLQKIGDLWSSFFRRQRVRNLSWVYQRLAVHGLQCFVISWTWQCMLSRCRAGPVAKKLLLLFWKKAFNIQESRRFQRRCLCKLMEFNLAMPRCQVADLKMIRRQLKWLSFSWTNLKSISKKAKVGLRWIFIGSSFLVYYFFAKALTRLNITASYA